jgi:hypothetical protein
MTRYLATAIVAAVASALAALPVQAADITGSWAMSVQTSLGAGSPTFVLKQQGKQVSGTYSGALGSSPVTGSVDGNKVRLTFQGSGGGQQGTVEYVGTVDGTKMSGSVKLGSFGQGTFTGSKK